MKTYPLLQSQLGIFMEWESFPQSTQYNLPTITRYSKNLDSQRLAEAVEQLPLIHPTMRTHFVLEDGIPRQYVDESIDIKLKLSKMSNAEYDEYVKHIVRPYDLLSGEPLWRFELIETEDSKYLFTECHHSIGDGITLSPNTSTDLCRLYAGEQIAPEEYNILNYAEDEVESFKSDAYQRAKAYYRDKFAGYSLLSLSSNREHPWGNVIRYSEYIPVEDVDAWCSAHSTTSNLLFMAAFAYTMSRLCREDSVAFSSVNHGRMDKRLMNTYGMYVKSSPILAQIDRTQSVIDFVKSFRRELMSTIRYGVYPFNHFCSDLKQQMGVSFGFQGVKMQEELELGGEKSLCTQINRTNTSSDLNIVIYLRDGQYDIRVETSDALYAESQVSQVARFMRQCVCAMMANPDAQLGTISLLSDDEVSQVLALSRGKSLSYDTSATFVSMVLSHGKETPDAVAVVDAERNFTYGELNECSARVAQYLMANGVTPGEFVGVMLPRTGAFLASILAVMRLGAAYLPIDCDYPEERRAYMREDSGAAIIITPEVYSEAIKCKPVDLSLDKSSPSGLAYMIYTSGSTGKPKGVMQSHRSLTAFLAWRVNELSITAESRHAQHASFSFDASLDDLLCPLAAGGQVHIISDDMRKDMPAMVEYLREHRITCMTLSTALGMALINQYPDLPLQFLMMGGEKMLPCRRTNVRLINGYGPTEFTVCSSFHIVDQDKDTNIPIGRPVPNTWSLICDSNGNLLPQGVVGELCLAGPQIAEGYLHRDEETKERFKDISYAGLPSKMYRTGDLARYNEDGELEYCGRIDFMVKLRGYRIELGEIENVASSFDGVESVAAEVKEVAGLQHLTLYYTQSAEVDTSALRTYMSQTLAEYMLPTAFVKMEEMPLTPNGKVNRKALPDPEIEAEEIVAPATELESQLLNIATSLLGFDQFGVTSNLLSIGLSSLMAMRLSAEIDKQLGLTIQMRELIAHPTLRDIAQKLTRKANPNTPAYPQAEYYPLTENQRGVYIDWDMNRDSTQYNIPGVERYSCSAEILADAIKCVVNAHPFLKVHFVQNEGDLMMHRLDDAEVEVTITHLDNEPDADFWQQRLQPYNLIDCNLYRFEIYTTETSTWLFFDFHHTIADGGSLVVFLQELKRVLDGQQPLGESLNAFDQSLREKDMIQSKEYAEAEAYFDNLVSSSEIAVYPHASKLLNGDAYSTCYLTLDRKDIDTFCRQQKITVNSFMLTALMQVLHRVTREEDILITTISNGRGTTELQNSIGMFVKTLPLCSKMSFQDMSRVAVVDAVRYIQQQFMDSMSRDFYPYTHIVQKHGIHPEIMFVYQGGEGDFEQHVGVTENSVAFRQQKTKFPILLTVYPSGSDKYLAYLEYDGQLFTESMTVQLLQMFNNFMHSVCSSEVVNMKLSQVSLLDAEAEKAVMDIAAGPKLEIDGRDTFTSLFVRQARLTPNALAVSDADSEWTYAELDQRSDTLARHLVSLGIRANMFVCVMLDRTKEFPLNVLAIHKAGAAYTPLDLEYPNERLSYMVENSGSKVVITTHDILAMKMAEGGLDLGDATIIYMDEIDLSPVTEPINLTTPDNLAYMIYTSGSTGLPKGVMLHQRGLRSYIASMIDILGITAEDRISNHRPFSFDAHIQDLYPALTVGGSIHIMPTSIRKDMKGLRDFVVEHRITGGSYTTSLGAMLLDAYKLPLRYMTMTGEKMIGLVSDEVQLVNGYGPTECTDLISAYRLEKGRVYDDIPIGRPMANSYCFIVDRTGNLLPVGQAGELCFASLQVGNGYWKLPEKTAEVFVDCPFLPEKSDGKPWRMYHTGDLCRWNEERQIEYLGRIDSQVKLRGFRIELGEIETQAKKIDAIQQAVALVKEVVGTQHLVLYYTVKEGESVTEDEIRSFMAQTKLAEYMQPEICMQLDAFPYNSSGKVNRKLLPTPQLKVAEVVVPATPLEEQLFHLVADILKHEAFGVTTNLISVGMNSLLAMKLGASLFNVLGKEVSTKQILSTPTVRDICGIIEGMGESTSTVAIAHERQPYYPLTENQRGVYIDWEMHRDALQYNIPNVLRFTDMEANRLCEALKAVVRAHPYMETRLGMVDGDVMQLRRDDEEPEILLDTLESEPDTDFFQKRIRPFNLFSDRLYRLEVYKTPQYVYLFEDFHHIVFDGTSGLVFSNELQRALRGEQLTPETYSALDRAIDEKQLLDAVDPATSSVEQWFDNLVDGHESALYPKSQKPDVSTQGTPTGCSASASCKREAIDRFCRDNAVTANSYFLTTFMQVLHRLTRESNLLITTISNGRQSAALMNIIGMFVKTMPVASSYNYEELKKLTSYATLVKNMQDQLQETFSYDYYPLTRIVEKHSFRPNIIFEYQGGIMDASLQDDGVETMPMLRLNTAKVPMEVSVFPSSDTEYQINVVYDGALYSSEDVNTLLQAVCAMAEGAAQSQGSDFADVALVSGDEQKRLVEMSAGPRMELDFTKTYMDFFLDRCKQCPDSLAVADDDSEITYSQLNRYSDLIARKLMAEGVGHRDFVGVMIDRSKEFPVCVFGIHKAGAAYLPLDIEYPNERLQYMMEDSGTQVLITTHKVLEEKRKEAAFEADKIIYIDDIDWENESADVMPVNQCTPDCYTYIIYTSGSTGKPKGVVLHHKGLLNYIFSTIDELHLTSDDRLSSHRSFSFDSHIEDLYAILLLGGSLHIMPEGIRKDLQEIYNFVVRHKITGGGYTTSIATMLCNNFNMPVRYLSAIGEKLMGVVSRDAQIINAYGPTECTDHISIYYLEKDREYEDIPIGHVIANSWCFIVDSAGQLAPKGAAGELCIAGIQVGVGYWHRPELNAKAFVPCPFVDQNIDGTPVRMYHTGDLARYNQDGQLECIGRIDNQVKLRGFRIELGEIETEAMKVEGVQQSVAAIREINGEKHLVLYYTVEQGYTVSDEQILTSLSQSKLATYMVPEVYMYLDKMPRTPNGKINRKALPAPVMKAGDVVAPETETEKKLFDIAVELLKHDQFGVTTNLITIGLTSLSAMKLTALLQKKLEVSVPVADLLGTPTIREVAEGIDNGKFKSTKKAAIFTKREAPANKPDTDKPAAEGGAPAPKANPFAKKANPFAAKKNPFDKK